MSFFQIFCYNLFVINSRRRLNDRTKIILQDAHSRGEKTKYQNPWPFNILRGLCSCGDWRIFMSMNIKRFIDYDRAEKDKLGRTIHIYRQSEFYLNKEEAQEARNHKEQMKLKVWRASNKALQ